MKRRSVSNSCIVDRIILCIINDCYVTLLNLVVELQMSISSMHNLGCEAGIKKIVHALRAGQLICEMSQIYLHIKGAAVVV
jgi:hypothetical protein